MIGSCGDGSDQRIHLRPPGWYRGERKPEHFRENTAEAPIRNGSIAERSCYFAPDPVPLYNGAATISVVVEDGAEWNVAVNRSSPAWFNKKLFPNQITRTSAPPKWDPMPVFFSYQLLS